MLAVSLGVIGGIFASFINTPRPVSASQVTLTYRYSSFTSGATWTVPAGVTSITFDMRGGAGGTGGSDGKGPGRGGPYGRLVGTLSVTQGTVIGIFPGGSGGNGSGCFANASGGAGGVSSYKLVTYNGGRGGNAGNVGCSGGGGGGGAASILTVDGVVKGVAAGAGGGGGGNNVATPTSGRGAYPHQNQTAGSTTISGAKNGGGGLRGDSCTGSNDGGGSGGGGGGDWSGQAGEVINGSECRGQGGWRGDNRWDGSALNNLPTGFTSSYTISDTASVIYVTYELSVSAPDLTAATDLGLSNSDNRTTWNTTTKPQFTGTTVGGAQVSLGVNGSYSINCGNANTTTGVYTCNWTPSSDGTFTITARSTVSGVSTTSTSISVIIDTVRPTATLTAPVTLSTSRTLTYSLGFSESITDLTSADFSNSGTATCTAAPSNSTGTNVTVTVTCTTDGTVVLALASGGVFDIAGNSGPASAVTASSVTIDTVAPQPGLTAATINNSGSATVRSSEIGTAYLVRNDVVVSNLADITGAPDNQWNSVSITQANTNTLLSAAGLSEGTYVLYTVDVNGLLSDASTTTVIIDNTPPSATWTVPTSPVRAWSFNYTLTFTESIAGLSADNFSYTGTATGCVISPSGNSGTSFTIAVTCTSDGTLTVALAQNSVNDVATNAGPTSIVSASQITIDAELEVTYDSQSGSDIPSGLTMVGGAIASSPGTPERAGYSFVGWATDPSGTAVTFPYTHGSIVDFTMYAIWSANTVNVTFNSGGGSAVAATTVKTDATLPAPDAPTRVGYTFAGWWTTPVTGGTQVSFPYTHERVSDFTLFARWTGNTLVVTFNSGDGSAVPAGETVSGGTLASPAKPTREGFAFDGWSPLEAGGSPVRFPYAHGRTTDFTLYAIWRSDAEPNNVWFYPAAGRATLGSLTFSPKTDAQNVMVPQFPRSSTTYEVSTTVTQPAGVEQIDTITMCWFKSIRDGEESVAEPGVSDTCENAATNPETELKAVWAEATQTFEIVGGSNHRLASSTTSYVFGASTMNITFAYNVSYAMRAGDWTVAVIVTDKGGAAQRQTLDATVVFTATSSTGRQPQSFGPIAPGSSVTINDFPAGEFTANANAKLTISATLFAAGAVSLQFADDDADPTAGQVALDCSIGSILSNPIRVPNVNAADPLKRVREFAERLNPTAESQRIRRNMSCRLTYGGGASRSLVQYSSTVTFGLGASL